MDTISTAVGGALLAKALPQDKRGPLGVWTVTLAALVPDADVLADFFVNDPLSDLTVHRGFTHSLLGVALMAPLLALALRLVGKDRNYRRLLGLATLGFAWHLFTDLATSWGTMVLSPFSRQRVVWDLLFIVDFVFTSFLLLPQVTAWIYRGADGALRRGVLAWLVLTAFTALVINTASGFLGGGFDWGLLVLLGGALAVLFAAPAVHGWGFRQSRATFCRIGVGALAAYLGLCTTAHFMALGRVEQFCQTHLQDGQGRGRKVVSRAALPQPLSPFRWSGLVQTAEGVYQSWFSVLESAPPRFEFFPSDNGNEFARRAAALPDVKTYLWFARFPVARYRADGGLHIVEYSDRRFNSVRNRNSPFVYRVVFNHRGVVLSSGFERP